MKGDAVLDLRRAARPLAWGALAVVLAATPAAAQYFGKNKVRYQSFDFQVLATEHFDVYYYESEREAAERAARMAERWYSRLSRVLDHKLQGRQPLILYASAPHFQQTNAIDGDLGEGTGGVTEYLKRRIVLPLAATPGETDHVIGHELVHAFQYDITGHGHNASSFAAPALSRLPLWFVEGMAEYLSLGAVDPHTAMWMRDAAANNDLPSWSRLNDPRYFPYRYGQALWAYVAGRWGEEKVGDVLRATRRDATVESAFREVLGVGPDTLVSDWHQAVRNYYELVAHATRPASETGRTLVRPRGNLDRINVSPSLSPDGSRLMFLSERDLFSIDLYLADAHDGRVLKRVTRTAVDPHFQSLQFLNSAGAWSPDGARFALATLSAGRPVMAVLDGRTLSTRDEIPLPAVDEAFGPTWSPDGSRIAFSGMSGGSSDLFVLDVATRHLQRLTHDMFADLMPAWSPDGRTLAFVTDREGSRPDELAFANERIALADVASGAIRVLPNQTQGKHINPQWTPDGASLLLISDRDGIANVYRMDVTSGVLTPVTNVATGVSGITRLSPALSMARGTDAAVVSLYQKGGYSLVAIDPRASVAPPTFASSPAVLPPAERRDTGLEALIESPTPIPPASVVLERRPYRPRLSLDYVGQPSLGVSTGSNGVAVGGGTGLYWSDMLGNHQLATALSFNNGGSRFLENMTGIVAYGNRRHRWDWGVTVAQIPYFTRDFVEDAGFYGTDSIPAVRDREYRSWQIDRQLVGQLSYPFNRVFRAELSAGYRQMSFANDLQTSIYDANTGELLVQSTQDLSGDSLRALNFATSAGALVYDNSVFGGTSPVMGQRARIEVSPVFGDLRYVGLLGDLRRYELPLRSLALAGRVLHFGRYGPSAEDNALQPLYAGYGWLMRGYDPGSFTVDECPPGVECPFDRLLGSRIAVANAEVRLMLLGPLGWIPSSGFLPVEATGFVDAGVAWNNGERPSFLGGTRDPLTSHGLSLRINLFGYAVGEMAFVHPNDRPGKGWHWQFMLQPGF
jgi:WD40 repeat protein